MPDNEIIRRDPSANLPAPTKALMQGWRESPRKSYDSLPEVISHEEILASPSPTLSQIAGNIGEINALGIISMAIEDVNRYFRADRRMTEADIVFVARAILRRYWYLKPEDIKKCFTGPRPKQFVLEGDSFLSWLAGYDLRRDNACEDYGRALSQAPRASLGRDARPVRPPGASQEPAEQAVSFEDWCKSRPREGNYLLFGRSGRPPETDEEKKRKEADFQRFRREYLKSKGITPKQSQSNG